MGRKQTIIIYPHLNDCGGDLTKDWYVEYHYHIPGEAKKRKERIYKGVNTGDDANRRRVAASIIKERTVWLKSGEYLKETSTARVYEDELTYRQEAKLYGKAKAGMPLMRRNISDYLAFAKQLKNGQAYQDLQSKLRMFSSWLEKVKLADCVVANIEKQHIQEFVFYLVENFKYSKVTVKKYLQAVRWYFDFELDRKAITVHPVYRIINTGLDVDEAAVPFTADERCRLKDAIEHQNPQLWLACQIQFYCAIRPGTELRLMRCGWIDFDNSQIRVPCPEAKNRTTEIVDVPDYLNDVFLEWGLNKYPADYYVLGKSGKPDLRHWGKNHFRFEFNRYRTALGIPENRKFYSWKHTGAIQLIQNGAKPYDLMEHLRHKDFATTEKYLRKRIKQKDRKINKFSSKI